MCRFSLCVLLGLGEPESQGSWSGHCLVQAHPKQGQAEQVVLDHALVGFEHFQEWKLHNLCGQPVPVLSHPHVGFQWDVLEFSSSGRTDTGF